MATDRREHILDAAIRVLEREGPRGFRQTKVAEEAGVEQGHLTYYFPKKADLEAAVFARIAERQRESAAAIVLAGEGDPRARVADAIKAQIRNRRATRMQLSFFLESDDERAVRAQVEANIAMQRQSLAAAFGREHDDPRVELALAAIRGLALDQMLAPRTKERVDALVDSLLHTLARAK